MLKLKVEYVSIDDIKPYEHNAKLHPDEQIEQIAKSIEQLGFNDPIGVWNGEIVEGHGRYLAAQRLGIDEVPIIRLDDLTDEQRKAYGLIHNQLTINSGFDLEALQIELQEIGTIDMSDFNFEIAMPNISEDLSLDLDENASTKKTDKSTCHCPKCGFVFEV